ncbi:MAG: hypothetical protein ABW133_17520 [Polyangiaceae bacterium]
MAEIDDACRDVVASVDGAVACGVIDLATGMLLGSHVSASFPPDIADKIAVIAVELFRGANVGRIEKTLRSRRSTDNQETHVLEEVHATSRDGFHLAKAIKGGKAALVLLMKRSANQGIGWAQMKAATPKIESQLP